MLQGAGRWFAERLTSLPQTEPPDPLPLPTRCCLSGSRRPRNVCAGFAEIQTVRFLIGLLVRPDLGARALSTAMPAPPPCRLLEH